MFLLLACVEVPLDTGAEALQNVISGTVTFAGSGSPSNTFVLLFPADDPPPPYGTGAPVNFTTLTASDYTGEGQGLQSASYAFPAVPDGSWVVTALSDSDGNFQPQLDSHAGATCGDVVGGHVQSLSDTSLAPLTVAGGSWLQNVPVLLASTLTTQRPVFTFDPVTLDQTQIAAGGAIPLRSDQVWSRDLKLAGPLDLSNPQPCNTFFPLYIVDADGDGVADPHPTFGQYGFATVWPHIYLVYAGEVEEGESWISELMIPLEPLGGAALPLNTVLPFTELTTVLFPVAQHTLPDGSVEVVQAPGLPAGPWAVSVVSITGQTWTVPNDSASATSLSATWDPAAQGAVVMLK